MDDVHVSSTLPLKVSVQRVGDVSVVRLSGELDLAGATVVRAAFRRIDAATRRVVLDLSRLEFIDSVGLTLTLREQRRAIEAGRDFVVSGAGPEIVRVFRLAGIDEEVRFAPDVRAAI
jgi:anti-sigma B factor antagonist